MLIDGCDIAVEGTGLQRTQHQKHGRGTSFSKPHVWRLEVTQKEHGDSKDRGFKSESIAQNPGIPQSGGKPTHQEMQSPCPESLTASKAREQPALSNGRAVTTVLQPEKHVACQSYRPAMLQERSSRQAQVRAGKQARVWEISAKTGTDTFLPKLEGAGWVQAGLQGAGGQSPARCGHTGAACATQLSTALAQSCVAFGGCSTLQRTARQALCLKKPTRTPLCK